MDPPAVSRRLSEQVDECLYNLQDLLDRAEK